MSDFLAVMRVVYDLFNLPINLYGFEISLWQGLMFGLLVSIVFGFVGRLFYDD